jgi:hypothetical protein
LTARLEKIALSEKMIEEDLSRVEESATKSTYRLGVAFERCEKKGKKSAPKFVPNSSYHKEEEALKPTKAHYPSNPKPFAVIMGLSSEMHILMSFALSMGLISSFLLRAFSTEWSHGTKEPHSS